MASESSVTLTLSAVIVYQYRLRSPTGRWLADVVLRSDGFFATVSDYGNYSFRWTSPGMEFRSFVAQLEGQDGYVCSKLGRKDWWDGEATLLAVKRAILNARRKQGLRKKQAREEWDTLADALDCAADDLRHEHFMDQWAFHDWWRNTSLDDATEYSRRNYEPDLRGFCREVLPLLAQAIREELAREKEVPHVG